MEAIKPVSFWLGSFICVAALLFFHFGIPLVPIALGGALAFTVTLFRYLKCH